MTSQPGSPDHNVGPSRQALDAARLVYGALPGGLASHSVAEIGFGAGAFGLSALEMGVRTALVFEGGQVIPKMPDQARMTVRAVDLEQPFDGPAVDLAVSLDVAQRLSQQRASGFVHDLTRMAPAVLFSAAIPGQGGVGHTNEQWQSYWAGRFAEVGYAAYDVVRPQIWTADSCPAEYRQNVVLYLREDTGAALRLQPVAPTWLDRVHPVVWARAGCGIKYGNDQTSPERQQAQQQQQ